MNFIKHLFKFFYLHILHIEVNQTVTQAQQKVQDITHMDVTSIKGFTTTFVCEKITYVVKYDHKFFPVQKFNMYKLYAAHSEDIPLKLKNVLSSVHFLPSFKGMFNTEHEKRCNLIKAYVDLVTRKQIEEESKH